MNVHEASLASCLRGCVIGLIVFLCFAAGAGLIIRREVASNHLPVGYDGSPRRGRQLMTRYGCTSCHAIAGMPTRGLVGPSLDHMATRSYIAGRIENEQIDMEQWLEHPQKIKPGTAMPDLNVTAADARDMAAYLATLR